MSEEHPETVEILNRLTHICMDAEEGYQAAANCIRNRDLRDLFERFAHQRELYAVDLQSAIRTLGEEPAGASALVGALWRGWANIKGLVVSCDELAILAECRQGEEMAEQAYAEALKQKLPPDVQAVLERQLTGIREAHQRLNRLTEVIEQARQTAVVRA